MKVICNKSGYFACHDCHMSMNCMLNRVSKEKFRRTYWALHVEQQQQVNEVVRKK